MRVAIYTGEIPTSSFIERLIAALAKQGVEVLLVGRIKESYANLDNVIVAGYRDNRFRRLNKLLFFLKYLISFVLFRRKEWIKLRKELSVLGLNNINFLITAQALLWHKPDVFHLQWAKSTRNFMWVKAFKIKYILSFRGAHINYSPITVKGLAEMYRECFPVLDGFHGVSKAICEEASKYGAELQKCKVIYSGLNQDNFLSFRNEKQLSFNSPIRIISVGRDHWKKGYSIALDTMALLKGKDIDFRYTIVGTAGSEKLDFQIKQLGLQKHVELMPRMSFNKTMQLITESDMLLLSSLEEGIANVVLEAMACGTLVISTNCGGMSEVVKNNENGLLIEISNRKEMLEAIEKLLYMPENEKKNMQANAFSIIQEQHSEEAMFRGFEELYQNVLENRTFPQ